MDQTTRSVAGSTHCPGQRTPPRVQHTDGAAGRTRAAARSAIFEYIEGFYNAERRHTTLGNLSPADYESAHAAACSV